jgi:hypothetical protein
MTEDCHYKPFGMDRVPSFDRGGGASNSVQRAERFGATYLGVSRQFRVKSVKRGSPLSP